MALADDFKIERPLSITLRLPRKFAKDGIFPTRGIVLQSVLDVVGDKNLIYCFQRLSASHFDVTFAEGAEDARDSLLEAGITLQGVHLPFFESDPKTISVTVKNLPAEIDDDLLMQCLSTYGEALGVTKVLDDDGIWMGDRTVEMVIRSDIPSLIRLGTYPIYIRYRGQKLCCHHCNRWGHAVSDCPYKKHSLCIRCGSAGHTARYCSHPWVLDNSPVSLSDLNYTPSPPEGSQPQPDGDPSSQAQSGMVVDETPSAQKRKSDSSKPKKKKNKNKENPEAFENTDTNVFSLDDLPFASQISEGISPFPTGNRFAMLDDSSSQADQQPEAESQQTQTQFQTHPTHTQSEAPSPSQPQPPAQSQPHPLTQPQPEPPAPSQPPAQPRPIPPTPSKSQPSTQSHSQSLTPSKQRAQLQLLTPELFSPTQSEKQPLVESFLASVASAVAKIQAPPKRLQKEAPSVVPPRKATAPQKPPSGSRKKHR